MTLYEAVSTLLELYIAGILTAEYFFGRSDMDIRNEARKKAIKREKPEKSGALPFEKEWY